MYVTCDVLIDNAAISNDCSAVQYLPRNIADPQICSVVLDFSLAHAHTSLART